MRHLELAQVVLASQKQLKSGRPTVLATIMPLVGGGCMGVVVTSSEYESSFSFRPGLFTVDKAVTNRRQGIMGLTMHFGAKRPSEAVTILMERLPSVQFQQPEYQFGSQRAGLQLTVVDQTPTGSRAHRAVHIWASSPMHVPNPPQTTWEAYCAQILDLKIVESMVLTPKHIMELDLTPRGGRQLRGHTPGNRQRLPG